MTLDNTISQTILQQAGRRALVTAGAHNFTPLENGVRFNIHIVPQPDGERAEIMSAEIILEPTDLYSFTVTRFDAAESAPYYQEGDLFFDNLDTVLFGLERGTVYDRERTSKS